MASGLSISSSSGCSIMACIYWAISERGREDGYFMGDLAFVGTGGFLIFLSLGEGIASMAA